MMVKVVLKTRMAGPGGNWGPGDVVEMWRAQADEFVAMGWAVYADEGEKGKGGKGEKGVEAAVMPEVGEKAVTRGRAARKKSGK